MSNLQKSIERLVANIENDSYEPKHCERCAVLLPDKCKKSLCQDCDGRKQCYNCFDYKSGAQFFNQNSIICLSCAEYRGMVTLNWSLIASVSDIFYGNERRVIAHKYENDIEETMSKVSELSAKKSELQAEIEENEQWLSVIEDEFNESEETADTLEINMANCRRKINILTKEVEQVEREEAELTNGTNSKNNEKSITSLQAKQKAAMKQYTLWGSQVQDLLDMIDEGDKLPEQIISQFYSRLISDTEKGSKAIPKDLNMAVALVKLEMIKVNFGICSWRLKQVESKVRNGEVIAIEDIIPALNPVKTWFSCRVDLPEMKDGSLVLERKTKSRDLYEDYVQWLAKHAPKKVMSEKDFSVEFFKIANPKGVQKSKSSTIYFKGCVLRPRTECDS